MVGRALSWGCKSDVFLRKGIQGGESGVACSLSQDSFLAVAGMLAVCVLEKPAYDFNIII